MDTRFRCTRRAALAAAIGAAVLGGMASLAGCEGRAASREREPVMLAILGAAETDPLWPAFRGGAERFGRAIPRYQIIALAPRTTDAAGRLAAMDELLSRKPAGIGVQVTFEDAASPMTVERLFAKAALAKVPVVTLDRAVRNPAVVGHVGVNLPAAAEQLGAAMEALVQPRRSISLIHADGATEPDSLAYRRFLSGIARQPNVVMLREVNTVQDPRPVVEIAIELAQMFPNSGLIASLDSSFWLSATLDHESAFRQAARGVQFATLSTAPPLWRRLAGREEGGLAAALCGPLHGQIAYDALEMLSHLLDGQRQGGAAAWVETEVVTPATLREFAERYSVAAGGLPVADFIPPHAAPTGD